MRNSIIHFHDLDLVSLDLYHYEHNALVKNLAIDLVQLQSHLPEDSKCIVFLPSQLFGSHHYNNELGLKNEALQANIVNAIEDSIISDVSALHFVYDPSLSMAAWIDASLLADINKDFNALKGEFTFLPEHLLFGLDQPTVLFNTNGFCLACADGSGFSGDHGSFQQFYASLEESKFDVALINSFATADDIPVPEIFEASKKIQALSQFHINFLSSHRTYDLNFFKRQFSLDYLKSQMNITKRDFTLFAAACITIFIAPLLSNYLLQSYASSYNEQTVQIFKQLNPSFKKLVNAKSQIDELSKNIPEETMGAVSSADELYLLTYLDKLNDPAFKIIEIDLTQQTITLSIESLSKLKLAVIQEALTQYSLAVDDSGLIENDNSFFGSLIIRYNSG